MKFDAAVVDATIIIGLAHRGLTDKVFRVFNVIYVSQAVVRETKLRGRQRRRRDVERFAKWMNICTKWNVALFQALIVALQRRQPKKKHRGEAESIAQAVQQKIPVFLTDDEDATYEASQLGIRVISLMELFRLIASEETGE